MTQQRTTGRILKWTFMLFILFFFKEADCFAQIVITNQEVHKKTLVFSSPGGEDLRLDIYNKGKLSEKKPVILFVFGGAFLMGKRDDTLYNTYFNALTEHGFKVISIDYRLGLKNSKFPTALNTKPLRKAIDTAVTDLLHATAFLIEHADSLGIDTSKIILSGSSAGAITVLQADWYKRNQVALTKVLPAGFQYAGVISFAGAILSYQGKPKYKIPPAPTMMFHGTDDKIVVYNKIKLFYKGFFGSKYLAKTFKKHQYPYYFQYVEGMGHEIAGTPMYENLDDIFLFIRQYIFEKKQYMEEVYFNDLLRKKAF